MEEDIKILENLKISTLKAGECSLASSSEKEKWTREAQAIENLLARNKELKEELNLTTRVQQNYKEAFYEKSIENTKLRSKVGKLEKMVDEMAEYISTQKYGDSECHKSIKDYFEKKVRNKNE